MEEEPVEQAANEPVGLFDGPRRWHFGDFLYLSSALAYNLVSNAAMFVGQVTDQIGAHMAYCNGKEDRSDFAGSVINDISKL